MSVMLILCSMLITGSWGLLQGTDKKNASQTAVTATMPKAIFSNTRDRDNFIVELSNTVKDMKTDIATLLKKWNKVVKPSSGTVSASQAYTTHSIPTVTAAPPVFVAFMVQLTPRLSHLGIGQIIRFDEVVINRGNGYDVRLGVFRCPVAGIYQFSLSIGSFGGMMLDIVKNGKRIGRVFSSRSRFGRAAHWDKRVLDARQHLDGSDITPIMVNTQPTIAAPLKPVQPGSEAHPSSTQTIVEVQKGDEVWVAHITDNQHDILFGDGMTTFSGHILRTAR